MTTKLRKSEKWTGEYRGVTYQVSLHGVSEYDFRPQGTWCYYLMIHEDQIPAEHRDKFDLPGEMDKKGRVDYGYMQSWLAGLDWHCGITWYSKEGGVDGAKLVFKAGCDYAHYWDEGHFYSLETVSADARAVIDQLLGMVPLLTRCSWDGCYQPEASMTKWGSGFIANKCIETRNAAFPDADPIPLPSEATNV